MNTGARRGCLHESSQENGLGPDNTRERFPAVARTKRRSPSRALPQNVGVWIAAENRLLSEALTRMLGKYGHLEINTVELSGTDGHPALGEAQNGVLLLNTCGNLPKDLETIQQVRTNAPQIRILLLGMSANELEFLQCVRAGVSGYLLQDASGEEVLKAIEGVAAGEAVCRGSLCGALFRYFERETCGMPSAAVRRKLGFSRREQQLIPLIAQGLTNKEIANHFSLSEQTVKNHVYRMKHKIGAEDRLDIVQIYRVQGFLV